MGTYNGAYFPAKNSRINHQKLGGLGTLDESNYYIILAPYFLTILNLLLTCLWDILGWSRSFNKLNVYLTSVCLQNLKIKGLNPLFPKNTA